MNEPGEDLGSSGLEEPWPDKGTWCNPPYTRAWYERIAAEAHRGCEVLALLPTNRFEVGYMQVLMGLVDSVCWIRGRVRFVSSIDGSRPAGNPYGSMILGLGVCVGRFARALEPLGICMEIGGPL